MKIQFTIDTSNAAFGGSNLERDYEIARILRALATRFADGTWEANTKRPIRDLNGNVVGYVQLVK